jgi:hypothetical protein
MSQKASPVRDIHKHSVGDEISEGVSQAVCSAPFIRCKQAADGEEGVRQAADKGKDTDRKSGKHALFLKIKEDAYSLRDVSQCICVFLYMCSCI